jgi:hypothetical protein
MHLLARAELKEEEKMNFSQNFKFYFGLIADGKRVFPVLPHFFLSTYSLTQPFQLKGQCHEIFCFWFFS